MRLMRGPVRVHSGPAAAVCASHACAYCAVRMLRMCVLSAMRAAFRLRVQRYILGRAVRTSWSRQTSFLRTVDDRTLEESSLARPPPVGGETQSDPPCLT